MGTQDVSMSASENTNLSSIKIELNKQLRLALPLIGINLVQITRQFLSVMFVGHLGELELSSASIANSICTVTGYSVLVGMASALETLCGQAYGAKQYHMMGIYLQRASIILVILSVPLAILWYNMNHVLLLLGQDPEISYKAGIYARYMIPGLFAMAFLHPLIKFLQTQGQVSPMFICSAATLVVHGVLCWFLVNKVGMGNKGAALTVSVSYWLNVVLLIIVIAFTPSARSCWNGFSRQAFKGIKQFLRLAIPSAIMICFEWWSFEVLVILSGLLPNPKLEASVFSVLVNTYSICYMIPMGLGAAVSTRISNELGGGRAGAARRAFHTSLLLVLVNLALLLTILFSGRNYLGKIYSDETEVIDYVTELVPYLAAIASVDILQVVISGAARGCGWQAIAACVNLGAYYIIGIPVAYVLAFRLGLLGKGLLLGMFVGVLCQAISLSIISYFTNWERQAMAAVKRIESSASETIPLLE